MAANTSLRRRLSDIVGDGGMEPEDRLQEYAVDGCVPRAVILPASEEQLSMVLALANAQGLAVMPRGSGGLASLGNLPQGVDIVLRTTRLKPAIDHRPDDLTLTVAAGVTFGVLQEGLAAAGQWLPLDPPLASRRTIGGVLATGLSGPLSLSQGTPRDMVIGMKVASTEGEVTKSGGRVVKNVTGFDLSKAHIGALGTLGVILQASFKVWPRPREHSTLMARYDSLGRAIDAVHELLALPIAPDAAEVVSPGVGWGVDGGPKAYLRFMGSPAGVRRRVREAGRVLRDSGADGIETLADQDAARAWQWIAGFGSEPQEGEELALRFGCLPSRVGDLASAVDALATQIGREHGMVVGPGRGVLRCLFSKFAHAEGPDVHGTVERFRELAASVDGYVVVEWCPPSAKAAVDVWGDPGDALILMRRLKEKMDPGRILNRGRYVGGI